MARYKMSGDTPERFALRRLVEVCRRSFHDHLRTGERIVILSQNGEFDDFRRVFGHAQRVLDADPSTLAVPSVGALAALDEAIAQVIKLRDELRKSLPGLSAAGELKTPAPTPPQPAESQSDSAPAASQRDRQQP